MFYNGAKEAELIVIWPILRYTVSRARPSGVADRGTEGGNFC